jgi:hypothetical protein
MSLLCLLAAGCASSNKDTASAPLPATTSPSPSTVAQSCASVFSAAEAAVGLTIEPGPCFASGPSWSDLSYPVLYRGNERGRPEVLVYEVADGAQLTTADPGVEVTRRGSYVVVKVTPEVLTSDSLQLLLTDDGRRAVCQMGIADFADTVNCKIEKQNVTIES